jgi:ribosome-binding factor A
VGHSLLYIGGIIVPSKNNNRIGRIDEEYRKELSQIIGYELKNPNVTGMISVTKVKVTPDLKYAKVYVSILNSKNIDETLDGLKKSSGFIRSELAKRINLRNTPELVFEIDDSMEYGAKIDSILKEILPKKED